METKTSVSSLVPVIGVDKDKCVNCHMCIAVCPVKYCIDGQGEKVAINHDLCIACGTCVRACKQKARTILDDLDALLAALAAGEKVVAIAAPAIVSSFPGTWRNFMGWLKRLGVSAFFDVGVGAELTVKSYLRHIKESSPELVIAQPCPAIVSYVEIYRPELIGRLAPADSPMLHTVKLIKEYWPQWSGHKVMVISPCAAKKREFQETGLGDFNVTFTALAALMEKRAVDLSKEQAVDFENPPAERGVIFSSPGGLLRTALREVPGIASVARKIEGPELVYPYLDKLADSVEKGINPLLVDCLNCEYGCNAGPGTLNLEKSPDEFENAIESRRAEAERRYARRPGSDKAAARKLGKVLDKYWRPGLYARGYVDRSANYRLVMPTKAQFIELYDSLLKAKPEDHLNCASCGYKSCEGMAIAVFNGLNKVENCHLYRQKVIEKEKALILDSSTRLHKEIEGATGAINHIRSTLSELGMASESQFVALQESSAAIEEMTATLGSASGLASGKRDQVDRLATAVRGGENDMTATVDAIRRVSQGVTGISEMTAVIHDVAEKTNLLSMNAAIQAAHAGSAGKAFAVVAGEIRVLAEATGGNAKRISSSIDSIIEQIKSSDTISARTGENFRAVIKDVGLMADEMSRLLDFLGEMASGGSQVTKGIEELRGQNTTVRDLYGRMSAEVMAMLDELQKIAQISEERQRRIDSGRGLPELR